MKWPTLKDRLKHPIKTEKEAVQQLVDAGIPITNYAKSKLKKTKKS